MARASITNHSSGMSEHVLKIPEFNGVDQSRGVHNQDVCSSPDATNFIARFGSLSTANGVMPHMGVLPEIGSIPSAMPDARLYQAHLVDAQLQPYSRLVAVHQRGVYALNDTVWENIGTVDGDGTDALNYRKGLEDGFEEWFLMTDGDGNFYRWNGTDALTIIPVTQGVEPDEVTPHPIQFQQIALLYDRLWGAVTKDQPDTIYWSQAFDPENWELDYVMQDDGGGFVEVPTFDGSRIRAIVAAFDDVLIFKDKSVHILNGTYPGEFSLSQAYGTEGAIAARTIVNAGSSLYFVASDGLCRYDGMTVSSMVSAGDRKLKDLWKRLNQKEITRACAVHHKNVLYISVPLDNDVRNSVVVEYHLLDGTYSLIDIKNVDDFLVYREEQAETLLMISGNQVYRYGVGTHFYKEPINARWISPEIFCGSFASKKSTGRIYMSVDAQSLDYNRSPRMKITMYNDRRERVRILVLKPGNNLIRKRVKIRGRVFRFQIENMDGDPLTINRGMEIHFENDAD